MIETSRLKLWKISSIQAISGGLVLSGFLLTNISWWFFLLVGAGAFGPGLLREAGWLRDKDEFQRRAEWRAAYHAWLVAGITAVGLIAWIRSGDRVIDQPQELPTLFLALLWFTWFLSSLLAYWGPQKTAARVLTAFGVAWLIFTIASNVGNEWNGWLPLLLHPLLTIPFFVLAWLSTRWPRVAGFLLLVVSVYFVQFFGWFRRDPSGLTTEGITFILFIVPLLAAGVALLFSATSSESVGDDDVGPAI